jgi:hypothetical protein
LLDGYSQEDKELLPKGTKIVGAVTQVVSGQKSRSGQPGRIDISLQTLVLPDGRSTPIYAFIERNPNLEHQQDPNKQQKGLPLASYGQSLKNSVAAFGNAITKRAVGMNVYYPGRTGHELEMEPGEVLPLRLNRPLDLPGLLRQPVPSATGQANPYASTPGMVSTPGLVDTEQPRVPSFQNQEQAPPVQGGGNPVVDHEPATKGIPDPF